MIKGGGDMIVDWIWMLSIMAFRSGVVSEDWRTAMIVSMSRVK